MERSIVYAVTWTYEDRVLSHTIFRDATGSITLHGWSADGFPDDNFTEILTEEELADYLANELRGVGPRERV